MEDPTKKVSKKAPEKGVWVDHETGLVHIPGKDPLPLVGPTSGSEYDRLKKAEQRFKSDKASLLRLMRATWKCSQCAREWKGEDVRVKKAAPDTEDVVFVCPDRKCDAPVVILKLGIGDVQSVRDMKRDGPGPGGILQ